MKRNLSENKTIKEKNLSEEVLRMKRLANIVSESQYNTKINESTEDINNNNLYRNLMDVLSSSNATRKEKKEIIKIILKDMDIGDKFRNIATNN
jgi:hypothetical protein